MVKEIKFQMKQCTEDTISLKEFYEWFTPVCWDIEKTDPAAVDLAYGVGLLLDEFTGGYRTEKDVKDRMKLLV